MGSTQKIAKGVFWSILVSVVSGIYGFISVPILINYFGKSNYGLIGLAMSVNVYLQLIDMGFNSTNVRFFSNFFAKKDYSKINKLFQTNLVLYGSIGIINVIILFIISLFTKEIFHLLAEQDLILKNLFYILMISAFISWYSSCFDQLVKSKENVDWVQRRGVIVKSLQFVILFITVYGHLSIEWYYALSTFSLFLIIPLTIYKIKKDISFIIFIPRFYKDVFKEIFPYCMAIFSFSIFQFSMHNLRPVFLGIRGTVESVADYNVLNGIIIFVTMIGGAFIGVLLPSVSKIVALKNVSAQNQVVYQGTKYISIFLCLCCFGCITVSRETLVLYVGEQYLNLLPYLNLWLLITLGGHNQAISSLILSGTNIKAISYMSAFSAFIGLLLSWFLIPLFDIGGVIIAYLIYVILQIGFYYLYYWPHIMKLNSWNIFRNSFLPFALLGAIVVFIVSFASSVFTTKDIIILFIIKGSSFLLLYTVSIYFLLNSTDKLFLKKLIHRI